MVSRAFHSGFTLVELLTTIMILGIIATFTIPKVIASQQNVKNKAAAKEAAGTIAAAYQAYMLSNTVSSTTFRSSMLLPYMNYVKMYTGAVDDEAGVSHTCGVAGGWYTHCILLHNGAVLMLNDQYAPSTETPNGVWVGMDSDGKYSVGNPSSLWFIVYMNGRVTTEGVHANNASLDPSWFGWN